jgi:hypothetical protein
MKLPPPPRPEDNPQYRQLKPEFAEALRQVGPQQYAYLSARLHRADEKPKRRRYAVM